MINAIQVITYTIIRDPKPPSMNMCIISLLGSPPAQPFSNSALAQLSPFAKTAPNSALTQPSPRPTQPFHFPTQPYVSPTQPFPNSALSQKKIKKTQ